MSITATGLGSGIDVEGIISKLMAVEQQPLTQLAVKEASYQAKLTAYGTLQSAVASFQTAANSLNSSSSINTVKATSSDDTVVSASGTNIAIPGSYTVETSQLAAAQTVVAAGQASLTASLGTGTLVFDFGTISGGTFSSGTGQYTGSTFTSNGNGTKSVVIAAGSDSLIGIRDAINAAGIGVTATIINDGSATPYRLALTSTSGSSNSLKISESTNPGAGLDTFITNDPAGTQHLTETTTASSAVLKVNGLQITQSTNTISSAIQGVSFTLHKSNVGAPATITVGKDSSSFIKSVESFAKAYNDLGSTIKLLTNFDPKDSTKNGLLLGDSLVNTLQAQVRRTLVTPIQGLTNTSVTSLSQIGVSVQSDGTLGVDEGKLNTALTNNSNDVTALFATIGRASDPLVSYVSSSTNTQPGTKTINVTTAASQGKAVGSVVSGTTITAGVNDILSLTIDGVVSSVTLGAGTYTQSGLNSAIQSAINGSYSASGISVAVTDAGGVITVSSNRFGSNSSVLINGGNGAAGLFGAPVSTTGLDVAGTIGGVTATGSGQDLLAADGLSVHITGSTIGARGTIDFTRGYGFTLNNFANSYLGTTGILAAKTDGVNRSLSAISDQRDRINTQLTATEARLRAQFTALDETISNLTSTSNFLTQQLSSLNASR